MVEFFLFQDVNYALHLFIMSPSCPLIQSSSPVCFGFFVFLFFWGAPFMTMIIFKELGLLFCLFSSVVINVLAK